MTAADTPAVELRHVAKSFGTRRVLDDVCLVVPQGRAICILGRSGTGKSVMLKMLIGLLKPDRGEIIFDGESVRGMDAVSYTHLTLPTKRIV